MAIAYISKDDEPFAALRLIAHLEAGDDVLYDEELTLASWWPQVEATVMNLTEIWLNDG